MRAPHRIAIAAFSLAVVAGAAQAERAPADAPEDPDHAAASRLSASAAHGGARGCAVRAEAA